MQNRASTLGNRAIKKRCVTPPVCAGGLTPRPARNHLGPIGAPGRKRFGHIGSIAGARTRRRFGRFMSEQACMGGKRGGRRVDDRGLGGSVLPGRDAEAEHCRPRAAGEGRDSREVGGDRVVLRGVARDAAGARNAAHREPAGALVGSGEQQAVSAKVLVYRRSHPLH